MRVLITGNCGFVGRRFMRRLLDRGDEVTGVDNLVSGKTPDLWLFKPQDNEKAQYLFCDVRTFFNSAKAEWYDLIIHCAAIVGGRLNIENDPLAVATDLSIDAELFNWVVRGSKKPKVIYFSSSAVYPVGLQTKAVNIPLAEDMQNFNEGRIGLPDMTYGFAKLAGEYLAKFAVEKYDLDVKIYRPFGGYGEDQDMSYPFPSIVKRVIDGDDPVIVWGSGEQRRDFIYIEDVVDCVLETMDVLKPGEALNIGAGVSTSFFELARMACGVLGKDVAVINDPTKPGGVYARIANPEKMMRYIKPKIALDEGIRMVAAALTVAKS